MSKRTLVQILGAAVLAVPGIVVGQSTAHAGFPIYSAPQISQTGLLVTSPFPGTTTRPSDAEGLAYVPANNSLWLTDDTSGRIYEIDRNTGALKNMLSRETLAATRRLGGSDTAGLNTASDFEALAYDQSQDVLYAFAGRCCTSSIRAAAFRLVRSGNTFVPESFQPFASPLNDFSGVGFANGTIYAALGNVIYQYDYPTNRFTRLFTAPVSGAVVGIGFSTDGADMWVTTSNFRLVRINFATRTVVPGYDWATATSLSIRDPRAVEVVGDQLMLCDGYDSYPSGSQSRYAIRSFSITGSGGGGGIAPVASFTSSPAAATTATPVSFVDTSSGSPTSWSWSFGDGTASSVQSPQHTYASPGTYSVSLTVSNALGSNSTSRTVTIAAVASAPVASFTSSPAAATTAMPVSFVDTSSGSPTSWSWSFGDGTASSVQSPQHTYVSPGTYSVSLTVSNALGSNSTSRTVTIAAVSGGPVTATFFAAEDAMVKSTSATMNYGSYAYVSAAVQSGATYRGYLKFHVTGLTGTVVNARLRVHAWDGSVDSGTWFTAPSTWSESTLTWSNSPAVTGSALNSTAPAVSTGTWIETVVTGVIAGNGTVTFAVTSTNADRIYYSSRETTQVAQLIVTTQ